MRNVWLDISSFIVAPKLLTIDFTIMSECVHAHTNTHIHTHSSKQLDEFNELNTASRATKKVSSIPVFSPQTYPQEMDLK